jgi:hypothetical protein
MWAPGDDLAPAEDDGERVSFAGKTLPQKFVLRELVIEVAGDRSYDRREWAGAIVVVEAGELEIECVDGTAVRFHNGAVLCLDALPIRRLRNRGPCPLRLSVVAKREPPTSAASPAASLGR